MKQTSDNKKGVSAGTLALIGFFMVYLAFDEKAINGNSIGIFFVGTILIIASILVSDVFRKWVLMKMGILEIDLDKKKRKKHEKK